MCWREVQEVAGRQRHQKNSPANLALSPPASPFSYFSSGRRHRPHPARQGRHGHPVPVLRGRAGSRRLWRCLCCRPASARPAASPRTRGQKDGAGRPRGARCHRHRHRTPASQPGGSRHSLLRLRQGERAALFHAGGGGNRTCAAAGGRGGRGGEIAKGADRKECVLIESLYTRVNRLRDKKRRRRRRGGPAPPPRARAKGEKNIDATGRDPPCQLQILLCFFLRARHRHTHTRPPSTTAPGGPSHAPPAPRTPKKKVTAPPRSPRRMGSLAPGAPAAPPRKLASFILLTALYLGCVPFPCLPELALVAWWRVGPCAWAGGGVAGRGARRWGGVHTHTQGGRSVRLTASYARPLSPPFSPRPQPQLHAQPGQQVGPGAWATESGGE